MKSNAPRSLENPFDILNLRFLSFLIVLIACGAFSCTPHVSALQFTPGVYREYTIDTRNYAGNPNAWRVTDPGSTNSGAQEFLPNQVFTFENIDLSDATRVELLMHHWTGHSGTEGQQVIINGEHLLDLPINPNLPLPNQEYYLNNSNRTFEIPIQWLKQGNNTVEGTIAEELQGKHWWGQWGWYWIKIRVWIDEEKATVPNGSIIVDANNKIITGNSVTLTFESEEELSYVEYFKRYEGFDDDGDSNTYDWHGFFDQPRSDRGAFSTTPPYSIDWDVSDIPDQQPGGISFIAVIGQGNEYRITDPIHGYSLQRDYSIKLVSADSWPYALIRNGYTGVAELTIPAAYPIETVSSIRFLMRSWNGQANEDGSTSLLFNNPRESSFKKDIITGAEHAYALDNKELTPLNEFNIRNGVNTLYLTATTEHHGCEVLTPGPGLLLRWDQWISDGWYLSNVAWVYYLEAYAPWVWSSDFGWVYQYSPRKVSGWNYNPSLEHFWAHLDYYPFVYLQSQSKWLQFKDRDENGYTFLTDEQQPVIIPNQWTR